MPDSRINKEPPNRKGQSSKAKIIEFTLITLGYISFFALIIYQVVSKYTCMLVISLVFLFVLYVGYWLYFYYLMTRKRLELDEVTSAELKQAVIGIICCKSYLYRHGSLLLLFINAVFLCNMIFDIRPAKDYDAVIVDKYAMGGRGRAPSLYYVVSFPPEVQREIHIGGRLSVSVNNREEYRRVLLGVTHKFVTLHKGFLGIWWYEGLRK